MKIETYALKSSNGNKIRKATRVVFPSGRTIEFMERMSKKRATEQALKQLLKETPVPAEYYEFVGWEVVG